MFKGFEPCYDKNSKVLILGSFPSVKSRQYGFYYGNKQNRFWSVLGKIFDEKVGEDIDARKTFLLKHNIALYDVVLESDLTGSMDSTLLKSKNKITDISFLLPPHTKVEKIFCNGKAAFNLLTENFKSPIEIYYLPSTSPANASFQFETWKSALSFLK